VRERIEQGDVWAELLALDPLFDEFDPSLVAAALARGAGMGPDAPAGMAPVAWVKLQVNLGRRDHLRPADLVGALLNGVGLPKDHVGKVEIKEGFSIVEVRAEDAERALHGLSGLTVRGRSVSARMET
jgi:ATP-dependent RNA helicase DeaD